MTIVHGLTIALLAQAQSSPPPYVQFMERADRYAYTAVSVGTCEQLGFVTDKVRAEEIGEKFVADAIEAGISLRMARTILSGAIERETEDMEYLSSRVDESDQASLERFADYWIDRCIEIARGPYHWGVIEIPPSDDAGDSPQ